MVAADPTSNQRRSRSSSSSDHQKKKKKNTPISNTGGLRRLPVVKPANELAARARKMIYRVTPDSTVKNIRNRAKKHGSEKMDALTKALCLPLRDCVDGYKRELRRLHPFERVVADLTARARQKRDGLTLMDVLDELHEARKEILLAGKDWIAKIKSVETAREAADTLSEGEERLYALFDELAAPPLASLLELQKSLRTTPAVRLDTPAVVLVGAPNVGKSSIVRAISSGRPEVNNYPFTTRGMTLGHVEVWWDDDDRRGEAVTKCQVMDSPGLLVRPDEQRNEMESLTLAAMQHLPTAVMYVMDLSGEAGDKCSSIQDQLQLRKEVRARFPRRPWVDVVSKVDLGLAAGARESLEEVLAESSYIDLSVHDGTGVEELRDSVVRMLGEVRVVLNAMAAVDDARNNVR
jgi:nucleolar GTP-binding protein